MTQTRNMPSNFFWGNSVSSMQTEGAWQEEGKGQSVYDIRPATANASDWHVAIDEYHRYEEDLDLLQAMHMNMYRIQISWSRVNPTGDGAFNEAGIAYYDRLIDAMIKRGITPMVCLYHFDMPLALAQTYNGFLSRHVVAAFVRFAQTMIDHFADCVPYWLTFNEHNLYFGPEAFRIAGDLSGKQDLNALYQIFHHTMLAHAQVDTYLHTHYPELKLGGMLAHTTVYPATSKPIDVLAAQHIQEFLNYNLYDAFTLGHYSQQVEHYIHRHHIEADILPEDRAIMAPMQADFLAFSYYRSDMVNGDKIPAGTAPNYYLQEAGEPNRFLEANKWGWTVDSLGLRLILDDVYARYHLPLFPIENGIGLREHWDGVHEINDQARIDYHAAHIRAMKDAIFEDGVPVLGYLGWGLIDIPSSHGDMEKRYGMVYVDRGNHELRTLKRVPKKSFYWFQQLLEHNGDDL